MALDLANRHAARVHRHDLVAPVSRQEITARFLSATPGLGPGLIAKTENERFRFQGDREPQIM